MVEINNNYNLLINEDNNGQFTNLINIQIKSQLTLKNKQLFYNVKYRRKF